MLRRFIATLSVAFLLAANPTGTALAHSVRTGALSITDLWTRATPPKAPTAGGYMTIENSGTGPDRLIAATSALAGQAEFHEMTTKDGIMTMRPVQGGIDIPAGGTVALAPGGFHIMFMDLKGRFVEGGKVPVTLTFEKAGKVETFLHVLSIGAGGPESDHQHEPAAQGAGQ